MPLSRHVDPANFILFVRLGEDSCCGFNDVNLPIYEGGCRGRNRLMPVCYYEDGIRFVQ
jgi:hypothetical protein